MLLLKNQGGCMQKGKVYNRRWIVSGKNDGTCKII